MAFPLIFCLRNTHSIPGFSFVSHSVGMRARGKNEISLVRACMHVCLTKVTFLLVQEQRQKMQLWPHKKCSGCDKHIQARTDLEHTRTSSLFIIILYTESSELCRPLIGKVNENLWRRSCEYKLCAIASREEPPSVENEI